jgi:SWI/SNF-related matrix-associated actin-dependent regulator of chromatin subfamily A3
MRGMIRSFSATIFTAKKLVYACQSVRLKMIWRRAKFDRMQVFRSAIKLCGVMADLDKKLSSSAASPIHGHTLMHVTRPDNQYVVTFDDGTVLGEANASLEQALNNIAEQQYLLDFEVFAPVRAIRETISRATKEKDAIVRVQITIYGPRKSAQNIGRELSQLKIYLQRPDYVRDGADYDNPHVLKLANPQYTFPEVVVYTEEKSLEKAADTTLTKTIEDVYSSLTRDKNLQGLEGDERLKTPLLP